MNKNQSKYLKLDLRDKKTRRPREEWRISRDKGIEIKTLKKIAQVREQYEKWINHPTPKSNILWRR